MKKKEDFIGFGRFTYRPFIRPKSEELLRALIQKHQPKACLEIGTFLGYSASVMLEESDDLTIISLEKDEQNAVDARENLGSYGERAKVLCCDAMDFLRENKKHFDLIFLDGPKGQYIKYLPFLKEILNDGGVLIADDILFHGKVNASGVVVHKHRTIVENLRKFLSKLANDPDFITTTYDFEDGVTVSEKIKK